jgi:hypothetical protein
VNTFALSALIALSAGQALAQTVTVDEYYVVRDPDLNKCKIVEHKPADEKTIVDNGTFKTRTDAEAAIMTMEACKSDLDDD